MSWLYASIGSGPLPMSDVDCRHVHPPPLRRVLRSNFYLAVGGIPETCIYHSPNETEDVGWAVLGLGIRRAHGTAKILVKEDWMRLLESRNFDPGALDGHFVVLRWNNDEVECFTDQLGLRTIYYARWGHGVCISTRLDWVARTTHNSEIDFSALGNTWLSFNQIAYESGVVGIDRVGPGGYLCLKNGAVVQARHAPWTPTFRHDSEEPGTSILQSFTECAIDYGKPVSLGLSGGLDSRLLLALATSHKFQNFRVHTFGDPGDPDVRISEALAREWHIERRHFNEPLPELPRLLSMIQSFVPQSMLGEPSSSILKLRYYGLVRGDGHLMIDGGFGEIARRQYLNRVALFGRRPLQRGDAERVLDLVRVPRGDFFAHEISAMMRRGAVERLRGAMAQMPPVEMIGVGNYVDLLALRTRVPNYGSPEQGRLDGQVMNFMPLIQPSFLKAIFAVDAKRRSRGKMYRQIIREKNPRLARYPLAKSGTTCPFDLPASAAWVLTKLRSRLGHTFADPMPDMFLARMREYVQDLAHSDGVRTWYGYDGTKVTRLVESYYGGDPRLRNQVDWWLTFELWRRSLATSLDV